MASFKAEHARCVGFHVSLIFYHALIACNVPNPTLGVMDSKVTIEVISAQPTKTQKAVKVILIEAFEAATTNDTKAKVYKPVEASKAIQALART